MFTALRLTVVTCLLALVHCKKHHLHLENEVRSFFGITSFGLYKDGSLDFNVTISFPPQSAVKANAQVMFTIDRKSTATSRSFFNMEKREADSCPPKTMGKHTSDADSIYFTFSNLTTKSSAVVYMGSNLADNVVVSRDGTVPSLTPVKARSAAPAADAAATPAEAAAELEEADAELEEADAEPAEAAAGPAAAAASPARVSELAVDVGRDASGNIANMTAKFVLNVTEVHGEGTYSLYFYNCNPALWGLHVEMFLTERNPGSYLSAGEIPLPYVYFAVAALFFASGSAYWYLLHRSKEGVYKLHYLILAAVYCKSLSLLFHGVNFHYTSTAGHREIAWAVIYYITYLMKTVMLFLTILLVGTGWSFIKHVFSDRDKKLFLVAMPLQVLAYVAKVIMEETEEGEQVYATWQKVVVIVDLLCCGAIMFPVIWSIRHLTEASQTDGKAALNLAKLKIFRHYYILIIAYIYVTQIIIKIVELAEPFQYQWLSTLATEVTTYLFVVVTAYKFRPANDNPYFRVPDDDDGDEEEVLTKSPALHSVSRVIKIDELEKPLLGGGAKQREASHDYD